MGNMRLKPALYYQLDYMVRASLSVLGVLLLVSAANYLLINFFEGNFAIFMVIIDGDISSMALNVGGVAVISLFIVGIVGIREDIKFFMQHGRGRYTTYFSTLLGSLISAAAIGLVCELFNLIGDAWHMFPLQGVNFGGAGFIGSWVMHTVFFFGAWQLGMLVSLLYYRMSKMQQIIFSVAIGGIFLLALPTFVPSLIDSLVQGLEDMDWDAFMFMPNVSMLAVPVVLGGVMAAGFNFLLLRRAQIKE